MMVRYSLEMRPCRLALLGVLLLAASAMADEATEKRRLEYAKNCGGYEETLRRAAGIQPADGIGESEAYLFARAYFYVYMGLCGGIEMPRQQGDKWVAETRVGYFGNPGPNITVEKGSGLTYAEKLPKVERPQEYLKFIKKK